MHATEGYQGAATRLVLYFRALVADPDKPHISEEPYVWSYINDRLLRMLLERVLTLFSPSPWEQSGLQAAMHLMTARLNKELQPVSVNVNDPLG